MTQARADRSTVARRRPGRPPTTGGPPTADVILAAAREVFGEVGYERTTITEVAERAGVTRPAVNHYFRGKQRLYDAVVADTASPCGGEGDAARAVPQRLGHLVAAATRDGAGNGSYARFLTSAVLDGFRVPEVAERGPSALAEIRAAVTETLAGGVHTGELRADLDIAAVTEMMIAMVWGMTLYAGFVGSREQLESVVEQFGRLLEGGLR